MRKSTSRPAQKDFTEGGTRTLSGAIANDVRRRILDGEIPDGSFMRQDQLARHYDTSRVPVREALGQLAVEGLIVYIPHRGAMVPVLSATEVVDLYETRAALEPPLIREAIPKMGFAWLRRIKTALEALDEAVKRGRMDDWGELNAQFHYLLCEPSERPLALGIVKGLLHKSDRYARLNRAIEGDTSLAQVEHAELYTLCARGSADEAESRLRDHLRHSGHSLARVLRTRNAK